MRYVMILGLFCMITGCNSNSGTQATAAVNVPAKFEFNTSDKVIETNGNMFVAFEKFKQSSNLSSLPTAMRISSQELTKSPYSSLGKMVMVKGEIYKIEELPPNPNLPGKMYEVLLLADNPNSPLGSTTIDCVCIGEMTKLSSGQTAACGGYFIGTFNSQNAMGGSVESLTIVGNIVNTKRNAN